MAETIPYTYTSRAEVESIFGRPAVAVRLDADQSSLVAADEDDDMTDVIEEATDEFNLYLNTRYAASALAESLWVRRRCSYLAAHFLSERQGNPSQYNQRVEEIREQLELIRKGRMFIPRVAYKSDFDPAMINTVIDDRYPRSKSRVQTDQSVGGTDSHINIDHPLYVDGY